MHGHGGKHPLRCPCLPIPKEIFDRFLCVLCGFARNSSSKIREFQKNCVSLQTSRRHGVPPCKHANRMSRASMHGGGTAHDCAAGRRTSYIKFMSVLVRGHCFFATDVHRPARADCRQYLVYYALINKRSLHCPIPKETPAFPCVPLAPLRENSRKLVFPMTKAWQNTRGHRPYCRVLHGKLFLLDVVSINICA